MLQKYYLFLLTAALCSEASSANLINLKENFSKDAIHDEQNTNESSIKNYLDKNPDISDELTSKNTHIFYKKNDYKAVWYPKGKESKAAKIALQVLKSTADEGLNPKDYIETKALPSSTPDWISKEVQLTARFLKYIQDIRVGRIDPQHIARFIKVDSPPTKPVTLLTEALQDQDQQFQKLKEMAPDLEDYKKLKSLLRAYRAIQKKNKDLSPIELSNKDLKIGRSTPDIIKLKNTLTILGFLKSKDESPIFDKKTQKALKDFQKYHSIEIDGTMGPETLKALNWSLDERIKKIIVNMERLRWLPDHLGNRFILVNVGGYEVLAVQDGKVEHRIKAIVGQKGRRTPLFYASLKNIIVNPSWGVPTSILVRDKIKRLANDPSYAEKAGFTVTDGSGHRVSPYSVDWINDGAHMHLRQSPGAHNALGRLKFNIATPGSNGNPYTVYMHGTPIDKLFKKETRNFSSGCIRLEKPTVLAAWILQQENGWDVEDIQEHINNGSTKTIALKNALPVYLTYLTVWVDDENKSHFSPDAYEIDDVLIDALDT